MRYLPLNFQLGDAKVLLVGGGKIATRKSRLLIRAGARVFVVAPRIDADLQQAINASGGSFALREYAPEDLSGSMLVISATDDKQLNQRVRDDAKAAKIPINVVDQPSLCDFIFPSIVDRSPVIVSVSSGGASPVLARQLRSQLETQIPANISQLADFIGRHRSAVRATLLEDEPVREFWERFLESSSAELVLAGKYDEAEVHIRRQLKGQQQDVVLGEVYLVGAGPGDPDLLTFKALRLMQKAEVVLYDRLVSPAILDMARKDAEYIYVGKAKSDHAVPQHEINQLLLDLALQGKRVLRLKGGDPFIFGRGGEEIELLAENQVPFQVVPGITAASGCASYSGIPLTHRDCAQSVRFITGHLKDGSLDLSWPDLVSANQTLVFYMGLTGLSTICEQLIAHGKAASTPIALIQQGTLPEQEVYSGTLETIVGIITRHEVRAPTLIIVGEVVALRDKLNWFKADVS